MKHPPSPPPPNQARTLLATTPGTLLARTACALVAMSLLLQATPPPRKPLVVPVKKRTKPNFESFEQGKASTPEPDEPNAPDPDNPETREALEQDAQTPPANPPNQGNQRTISPPASPRVTPQETPPTVAPAPSLEPIEITAAIYSLINLPTPFHEALVEFPAAPMKLEVADAYVFLQHPRPFTVELRFSATGKQSVVKTEKAAFGFMEITPPAGYAGGVVLIKSASPLVAWTISTPEQILFNLDRQVYARTWVAPNSPQKPSTRRARLTPYSIRFDLLPKTIPEILANPQTKAPWLAFLDGASKAKTQ